MTSGLGLPPTTLQTNEDFLPDIRCSSVVFSTFTVEGGP